MSLLKLRCNNDYLSKLTSTNTLKRNTNDGMVYKNREPIEHITFDKFFIKAVNKNIKKVLVPVTMDRILFEYNDNTEKHILYDKEKEIRKVLAIIELVGDVKIITVSDVYNVFESIYSKYYSTKAI
jgi:hypothetical protein